MMAQQQFQASEYVLDFWCPDCGSLLTLSYEGRCRYFCDNCGQEASPLDLGREDDNDIRVEGGNLRDVGIAQ